MTYRSAPTSRPKSVRLSIAPPTVSLVVFAVFLATAVADRAYFRVHSPWLIGGVALSALLAIADCARWLSARRAIAATLTALNADSEEDTSSLEDDLARADRRSAILRWTGVIIAVAAYIALNAAIPRLDRGR